MNQVRTLFHVRGIPVTADLGFPIGLFIMWDLAGKGQTGWLTAITFAVFVVIHEVGHAALVQHYGSEPNIRLTFLGGWAAYEDRSSFDRRKRNRISLAGPGLQFVAAIVAFILLRVVSGSNPGQFTWDLEDAVTWAGVVLAVMNLMPLFPLDGGHIAENEIHGRWGNEGRTRFLWWTLGASIVMFILGLGETSYASGIVTAGIRLRFESHFNAIPIAVFKSALSAFPAIATSWFIAFFCGFGAGQALYAEGSLRFGRMSSGRSGGAWNRPASRPPRRSPERQPRSTPARRTRKQRGNATVTPINRGQDAPHIDRASQADMDRLLDKISESGVSSLTPDERRRLDDHSRRLRGQ